MISIVIIVYSVHQCSYSWDTVMPKKCSTKKTNKQDNTQETLKMASIKEEDDWRTSCGSMVQQWGVARRRNFHTDVYFQVGEGKATETFSAHKIVLSFGSPVFEAMFYGQLAEVKSPISIVDIEPETFDILMRYFYGEEITFASVVSAAKVYFTADRYQVDQLKTDADSYISRTAIKDNSQFWEVMQQDKYFFIPAMKTKCLDYFSKNSDNLLNSELLLNLSLDVVKEIIQLNYLNASEYQLLSAVSLWGKGSTTAETQSNLKSLLPYIRFSSLTTEEFCRFNESHPSIIECEDSMAILKHLCNPSNFQLPQWCCLETQKRNVKYNGPPSQSSLYTQKKKRNLKNNGPTSQSSLHTKLKKSPLFPRVYYTGYEEYEHNDDKYVYGDYGHDDDKYVYGDYEHDDGKYVSDDYVHDDGEYVYTDYGHDEDKYVYDDHDQDGDKYVYNDYGHDEDKYVYDDHDQDGDKYVYDYRDDDDIGQGYVYDYRQDDDKYVYNYGHDDDKYVYDNYDYSYGDD